MNAAPPSDRAPLFDRNGLLRWLLLFATIIAGTAVAVIAWTVLVRFTHILILLLASFLLAYLVAPVVNRLERGGIPRLAATLLLYLVLFGALAVAVILLLNPLAVQVQAMLKSLPTYFDVQGRPSGLERFLVQHGLQITQVRDQVLSAVQGASAGLLSNTVAIVSGTVGTLTDILLMLVITFYRGQLIVAATVGLAAGFGCWLIGVYFPLVIGLLAFLFEFIPMLGPVLGMLPAVVIALFQPQTPVVAVIVYFIVLQQIESNLIVPRVSGHAVGLHPLAALLALLAGLELGGIGGALLAVPLAGVAYVLVAALYSDARGHSQMLVSRPRRRPYDLLARQIGARRGRRAEGAVALTPPILLTATDERLSTIQLESAHLREQFEADQVEQAQAEATQPDTPPHERGGPDDAKAPPVTIGG